MRKINFKKTLKFSGFVFLLLSIVILLINYSIKNSAQSHIKDIDGVEDSQVAIVLGAYVFPDGKLCNMLEDRVKTGVELYKKGKVKKLLMSGDHGKINYDEVNNMREYAENLGVPLEDIFMDHAGFSTYETMYRARDIFKIDNAVIITQEFHLPRAIYIAQNFGIDAQGVIADKNIYRSENYYEAREILARIKDCIQVNIIKSKPTFLGESIPIDGSGILTHDKLKEE